MGQVMDFRGKERKEPMNFITEGGLYLLKIVKHEIDGYTNEGNEKHKYSFECNKIIKDNGKVSPSEEKYSLNATYNSDSKQEWVFMNFADALKIDVAFNPSDLVGYYVLGEVEMKQGYTDSTKTYANLSPYGYRYSKMNDKLPSVKACEAEEVQTYSEPTQQPNNYQPQQSNVPSAIDVDMESVPF